MPMGWVMAWTTKLRKYTHVHNTDEGTRFVAEHTNEYEYIRHAGFEFWQPSDLTRGLGECPILSYLAIQEVE